MSRIEFARCQRGILHVITEMALANQQSIETQIYILIFRGGVAGCESIYDELQVQRI